MGLRVHPQMGLQVEIDQLLTEWIGIVSNNTGEKDYARTIKLMQERGLLGQGEKETEQSLRMLLEMSVSRFLKAKHFRFSGVLHSKPYLAIDSFSKLVVLLVKVSQLQNVTKPSLRALVFCVVI